MNIGIYGGTFNPIHLGHTHVVGEFARQLSLSRVLLVPTLSPPHKEPADLAAASARLAMCSLAAEEMQNTEIVVSDMEIRRAGKSYTADTVLQLRKTYPGDTLHLLMGEDMFLTLQDWWRPELIFQNCIICAAPRSAAGTDGLLRHAKLLQKRFGGKAAVVPIPHLDISSTEIRRRVQSGKDISGLVPKAVAEYILQNGIYQAEKEKRYDHNKRM